MRRLHLAPIALAAALALFVAGCGTRVGAHRVVAEGVVDAPLAASDPALAALRGGRWGRRCSPAGGRICCYMAGLGLA